MTERIRGVLKQRGEEEEGRAAWCAGEREVSSKEKISRGRGSKKIKREGDEERRVKGKFLPGHLSPTQPTEGICCLGSIRAQHNPSPHPMTEPASPHPRSRPGTLGFMGYAWAEPCPTLCPPGRRPFPAPHIPTGPRVHAAPSRFLSVDEALCMWGFSVCSKGRGDL